MFNDYLYPVIIVRDRYQGVYSGATWTAWNKYAVPDAIDADDCTCAEEFWTRYEHAVDGPVGRGLTPDEALADLLRQLKGEDHDGTPIRDH